MPTLFLISLAIRVLSLIRHCNPTALRLDFSLESRAHEFWCRDGQEFRAALCAVQQRFGCFSRLSFDNGYAVCIARQAA